MRIKWWWIASAIGMLFCVWAPAQAQLPNALFDRGRRFDDVTSKRPSDVRRPIRIAQQKDLFHETGTFESVDRIQANKQLRSIKSQLPKPNSPHKSLLTRPIARPRFTSPTGTSFTPMKVPNPGELSKLEFSDSPKTSPTQSHVGETMGEKSDDPLTISTFELKKGMQRVESAKPSEIPQPASKPKLSYTTESSESSPLEFDVSKPVAIEESEFQPCVVVHPPSKLTMLVLPISNPTSTSVPKPTLSRKSDRIHSFRRRRWEVSHYPDRSHILANGLTPTRLTPALGSTMAIDMILNRNPRYPILGVRRKAKQ